MGIVERSDDLKKIIDLVIMNLILGRLTDSDFNKNKDNQLIAISYDTKTIFEYGDYDYLVTIYYDVDVNTDVVYNNIEEAEQRAVVYSYMYGTYTSKNKYNLSNIKKYNVYKKKILLFTKYKFELQK